MDHIMTYEEYLRDVKKGIVTDPVSYTHLDVYKRQPIVCLALRLLDMKELINVLMCWQQ